MNTKTFAQQSRNLLMDGVAKKLLYWGFNTKGEVLESPQKLSGGFMSTPFILDRSISLWDRASKVMPGGVNASARMNKALAHPMFIARAEGAKIVVIDPFQSQTALQVSDKSMT